MIVKSEDAEKTINIIKKHNLAYKIGIAKDDPRENVTITTFQEGIITL